MCRQFATPRAVNTTRCAVQVICVTVPEKSVLGVLVNVERTHIAAVAIGSSTVRPGTWANEWNCQWGCNEAQGICNAAPGPYCVNKCDRAQCTPCGAGENCWEVWCWLSRADYDADSGHDNPNAGTSCAALPECGECHPIWDRCCEPGDVGCQGFQCNPPYPEYEYIDSCNGLACRDTPCTEPPGTTPPAGLQGRIQGMRDSGCPAGTLTSVSIVGINDGYSKTFQLSNNGDSYMTTLGEVTPGNQYVVLFGAPQGYTAENSQCDNCTITHPTRMAMCGWTDHQDNSIFLQLDPGVGFAYVYLWFRCVPIPPTLTPTPTHTPTPTPLVRARARTLSSPNVACVNYGDIDSQWGTSYQTTTFNLESGHGTRESMDSLTQHG